MGLGPDAFNVGAWDVEKSKGRKKKDDENEMTGCWFKFRFIGSCMSSKSKVDGSMSGTSTQYERVRNLRRCNTMDLPMSFGSNGPSSSHVEAEIVTSHAKSQFQLFFGASFRLQGFLISQHNIAESKSTNDTSQDQPVAPVVSSSTTSIAESTPLTPNLVEELKVASQLRKFSFNELKSSTRNFRPESLLGEGGFGCVFKGWINENGTAPVKPGTGVAVAVKTLNHDGLQGHKEWLAEVNYLGDLLHPNLVKLIGYCIEDDQRLLVYEFMPRGSLENHLFRRSLPLPWSIRMKVALGAAKGLAFLHEEAEKPVIYRDFKTSNILLDADYNAKLSDFGLAKDGPEDGKTHVSTRVMGTYGYAAPEYVMTGHLTSKSDVYSFGVVLLEMVTGRRSMDKTRPNGEHNLVEWARPHLGERRRFYRLLDPRLEGRFSIKGSQKALQLAAHCLSPDPKARPLMSDVVEALKPLPNLKDMACSSSYFQAMQAERMGSYPNSRNGSRMQTGFSRNGQPTRSLSIPNGPHASPYHHHHFHRSPKPSVAKP